MFPFSVITGKTIHAIISADVQACTQRVIEAYLAHDAGLTVNPDSYFLRFPDKPSCRIIALPAHVGGDVHVSGIKWIASYPENVRKGFPRASAVLVLNDDDTGYPFACLEASIISAARTAASAALAAERLHGRRRTAALGIVGNGLIARYVYTFLMKLGWEADEVLLHDTASGEAERFASEVCDRGRHRRVRAVSSVEAVLRESEVILLATVASTPHIHDPALFAHNPVVLHVSLRDLAPEILLGSFNIVDDVEHVMKAETSPHRAERLSGGRAFVTGTLAQLVGGACAVDRTKPAIFSPFGLGVLDVVVGKWVHDVAVARGEHVRIDNFFWELTR